MKDLNFQKEEYEKYEKNAAELQGQIRGYMDKFDKLKDIIHENSAKMTVLSQEVENKRMEQELLKTQAINLKMFETKRDKVKATIEEEKERLLKQVQTLKGLSSALETQLKN